jgi:recombination protein RecT
MSNSKTPPKTTPKQQALSFRELIEKQETKDKFKEMLGDNAMPFLHSALQVVQKDLELSKADPQSILNSVSAIASLNLLIDPSFGQAFLGTYKIKEGFVWKTLAQFQIGYKGLIELGHRSNQFKGLNTDDVREGELIGTDRMTGVTEFNWNQDQDARKKLPVIGYIAYFKLTNGFEKSLFMTIKEMNAHGQKWSKNFADKDCIWQKDFDGAGKKTALKLLLDKYAPKSTEMKKAIRFDQAIIDDIDGNNLNYADNPNNAPKLTLEESNRLIVQKRTLDFIANAKTYKMLESCYEACIDQETMEAYLEKGRTFDKLLDKATKVKKS